LAGNRLTIRVIRATSAANEQAAKKIKTGKRKTRRHARRKDTAREAPIAARARPAAMWIYARTVGDAVTIEILGPLAGPAIASTISVPTPETRPPERGEKIFTDK